MAEIRSVLTRAELAALNLLIERTCDPLDQLHADVLMTLIHNGRIAALPRGYAGYGITDVGLFDAGRPELMMGNLVAVCSPATHQVGVCSDETRLLRMSLPALGVWQTWRDVAAATLADADWYPTSGWSPVLELEADNHEQTPLTFTTPVRYIARELMVWHVGRDWTGHRIENTCPCRKAPCGLVTDRAPECVEHMQGREMRQGHRAYKCPAARQL